MTSKDDLLGNMDCLQNIFEFVEGEGPWVEPPDEEGKIELAQLIDDLWLGLILDIMFLLWEWYRMHIGRLFAV